eukprot:jgi/Chlat1/3902/Chrsp26S04182
MSRHVAAREELFKEVPAEARAAAAQVQAQIARGGAVQQDDPITAELLGMARHHAKEGREGTKRSVKIAEDTLRIGTDTQVNLQRQTAQMEDIHRQVNNMHSTLNTSETTIRKLNFFGRLFAGEKKVKRGKLKEMSNRSSKAAQNDADLKEKRKQLGLDGKKTTSTSEAVLAGEEQDDMGAIKQYVKEQDQDLDKISDMLRQMKRVATDMGEELKHQETMIDNLETNVDFGAGRLKEDTRRVRNQL